MFGDKKLRKVKIRLCSSTNKTYGHGKCSTIAFIYLLFICHYWIGLNAKNNFHKKNLLASKVIDFIFCPFFQLKKNNKIFSQRKCLAIPLTAKSTLVNLVTVLGKTIWKIHSAIMVHYVTYG